MSERPRRSVGEYLNGLRIRSGLSMDDLAKKMGFRGQSSVQRYLGADFDSTLRPSLAGKFALAMEGLGDPPITAAEIIVTTTKTTNEVYNRIVERDPSLLFEGRPFFENPPPVTGPTMRGFSVQIIGDNDLFRLSRREHQFEVFAPPLLQHVRGAYALLVPGRTMEPRFYQGEILYVNPHLPVEPGDFVVLFANWRQSENKDEPTGIYDAYIKQFVGLEDGKNQYRQFAPGEGQASILKIPFHRVSFMEKIVLSGTYGGI